MTTIAVEGEDFRVRIDGPPDGPALFLSNSLSSDISMWDDQIPQWSRRFRTVRYDSRGHGGSVVSQNPYSLDRLGRDALGIMDALGIARAHWCGLSMGGMVGMWMLVHAADRIDRAVLANTAAHMGPRQLWDDRIEAAEKGGMAAVVDATIRRWFSAPFREANPGVMARMRSMILGTPPKGYQGCCAAIRDMDLREVIRAVDRPVLVIIGANDPATTPADGELIAGSMRGASKVTLDAAHISNVEQPAAFASTVMDFLE